jgi:nucleosome binding factor SPN SPT16 subunit
MHKEFDAFIKSIEDSAKEFNVLFERPYRELSFEGNWNRARIVLQPTLNTLMSIVETPFFILPLNEVEIACFERVMPGIKSFDMVFIF